MLLSSVYVADAAVIDVHSHYIGSEYVSYLERTNQGLKEGFPLPKWKLEDTLSFMRDAGIDKSVLTLGPVHPSLSKESSQVIRKINESMAKIREDYKDRFYFAAELPLPDVKASLDEAVYALDYLKADGIALGSNIDGIYLGDAALDPLMSVLNERKAVVIVHPHKPYGLSDELFKTTPLAMFEYPADTTRAVVNMVMRNLPARYPDIRFIIPHGGSFLGPTIPRMKAIYPVVKAQGLVGDIDIDKSISSLYFDIAGVENISVLKSMLSYTTPEKIIYGSDVPYFKKDVLNKNMQRLKKEISLDKELAPYKEQIFGLNAEALFKNK